jgi:hypothetical protein
MSDENNNQEVPTTENSEQESFSKKTKKAHSFLSLFNVRGFLSKENVTGSLPFVFFLGFLAIMYIANSYNADKLVRQIDHTQKELKEFVSEYGSTKRMLQDSSMRTIVSNKVASMGLCDSITTQKQIILTKNDLAVK